MSKAKGKKGADKKKPDDEPEYKGPNIYKELLTKPVTDLEVDLSAPDKVLENENVEFQILVDRINAQCMALEADNSRLEKISGKVSVEMDSAVTVKATQLHIAVRDRNEVAHLK